MFMGFLRYFFHRQICTYLRTYETAIILPQMYHLQIRPSDFSNGIVL